MSLLHTLILFLGILPLASAQEVDLTPRLLLKNKLEVSTQKLRPYLFDPVVLNRLQNWMTHPNLDHQSYVVECQYKLRPFFPSEKIIAPLCYFLRQDHLEKRKISYDLIQYYLLEVQTSLLELSEDPRLQAQNENLAQKAKRYLKLFQPNDIHKIWHCFGPLLKYHFSQDLEDGVLNFSPFQQASSCIADEFHSNRIGGKPYFALNFAEEFSQKNGLPLHPGHSISPTGWIPGNHVQYLHKNDTSVKLALLLEEKSQLLPKHYPLNGTGSFESFLTQNPMDVFNEPGFYRSIDEHPVWSQKESIFGEILKSVRNAKETLFMDLFFLGGTMGANLAKELVQLLETQKNLKIFILRDNYNHFGHETEMLPIFNYLLAYSYKNPEKLVISGTYIKAHRSGLPRFLSPLISDAFLEKSGLQKHLALHGRAIADHSKVLVIDGTSEKPTAFVGSKNLTDASGAVCYDEVIKVTGPAAALVLDDYYEDMAAALKYEMSSAFVLHLAKQGWSKNLFSPNQDSNTQVANILKPFDLLDRNAQSEATRTAPILVPPQGDAVVRTGLNNWDSSRTNVLDQVIQLIFLANNNIYISDQFLFERNIILALMQAKEKNPNLDIRVILEPLELATPKGMPNLLYLDLLHQVGIQIKWMKVRGNPIINQEYHMKTISMDGLTVISGSANKDQTTMYGAFREEQLEVWDRDTTQTHDEVFLERWNSNQTENFIPYHFEVPAELKGFNGKPLPPKDFIHLLRDIVSILYDAVKI